MAQNSWTSITLLQRYKGVNVVGLRGAFFFERERERVVGGQQSLLSLQEGEGVLGFPRQQEVTGGRT